MNLNPDNKSCGYCKKPILIKLSKKGYWQRYEYVKKVFCSPKCAALYNGIKKRKPLDFCTRCNTQKQGNDFYRNERICRGCVANRARENRKRNQESIKIHRHIYYLNHKEEYRERKKKWATKNKHKIRLYQKVRSQKAVSDLSKSYINQLLTRKSTLFSKDIPQELIDIKKLQIQLRRIYHENKIT